MIDLRDDPSNDSKDRLRLRARLQGDSRYVGNPSATTEYAVCVFDTIGDNGVLVDQIEIPAGSPWAARRRGFRYVDPTGTIEGIEKIHLRSTRRNTNLRLTARGVNMTLPGPFSGEQYLAQDPSVIVQIENSEGSCWSITLSDRYGPIKNEPDRFRGEHK
jgi:hypothetical protein